MSVRQNLAVGVVGDQPFQLLQMLGGTAAHEQPRSLRIVEDYPSTEACGQREEVAEHQCSLVRGRVWPGELVLHGETKLRIERTTGQIRQLGG